MDESSLTTSHIIDRLREIFHTTEALWHDVVKHQLIEFDLRINYLLIGEAPPWHPSGLISYFYNPANKKQASRLLSTIHSAFHGIDLKDSNEIGNLKKIERLCEKGFLLIDMLPFGFNYGKIDRRSKIYPQLISLAMDHLIDKLDMLKPLLADDCKIRVMYKSQISPLRSCFPVNHFAHHQINEYDAINTSTFGVPYVKDIVEGFDLLIGVPGN